MKFSYTQKLYYKTTAKLIVIPLIAMILAICFFVYGVNNAIKLGVPLAGAVGFGMGFIFFPLLKRSQKFFDKIVDQSYSKYEGPITEERDAAGQGMDGERTVFGWFDEILADGTWSLLKNQEFMGAKDNQFDIDAIIVGPKGIFVFEIKNLSYDFLFTTEDCAVVIGDRIRPYTGEDPRIQVGRNAQTIEKLLSGAGLNDIRVKRAVIFARPESMKFLGSPTVYLIDNKDTLKRYILEQKEDPRFTPDFCEKVRKVILKK